jgi:hypothetical protein
MRRELLGEVNRALALRRADADERPAADGEIAAA